MARTQCVVIYSTAQCKARRVFTPDDDSQIPNIVASTVPGEAVIVTFIATLNSFSNIDAFLQNTLGKSAKSDRCMVKGMDGTVVGLCLADPTIDKHPHGPLMVDQTGAADIGQQIVNGIAQPRMYVGHLPTG